MFEQRASDAPPVRVDEPAPGVTRIRLNRPDARNAVDAALLSGLSDALTAVEGGAIVLGTTSPTAFSAGADLKLADDERARLSDDLYALYATMVDLPVPIIAALQGPAVGAGAQLAVAADLRMADASAWLRFPGAGHGLAVGAWALPSLVGRGRALQLCWSMRRIDAEEAHEIGLVDYLERDVEAAAVDLAGQIAGLDPPATARIKRVASVASELRAALEVERRGNRETWSGSAAGP